MPKRPQRRLVDPDLLDDDPDLLARIGTYLIVAVALLVSGEMLVYVAHAAGWHGPAGYALPVLVDVAGGVAGRYAYRRRRTRPSTRRYAKRVVYAALVVSCAGNLVGHAIQSGLYHPGPELVIVVSCVAPLVAAAALHLKWMGSPAGRSEAPAVPVQADRAAPVAPAEAASKFAAESLAAPDRAVRTGPDRADRAVRDVEGGSDRSVLSDDEAVRLIRELDGANRGPVSDRTIRAELACGAVRAKRLAERARAMQLAS